ncbi:SDR family NAD(P)-dependent oxidoreductase [Streptomyces sp. NPDC057137]|uniref:SDR family NAD(P)-dependent oxidoreductase n=1 Tax=Streptomyces sp. NPDC057137 TaxID=3346030 RepID=UPI003638D8A7
MRGLSGKVAVIAGAAPGNIGAVTARRLVDEGARVVVGDLNEGAARAVADELGAGGASVRAHGVDISDEASFAELIAFAGKEFGGVDSLFNVAADLSAGNLGRDGDVLTVPFDVWQHTIDVTLSGYMYGIRHALPVMIERGGGAIVNTMSAAVWMGEPVRVAYQAAKAGLTGLTRHTATVGGKHGVRCNSVAPGMVLTAAGRAATDPAQVEYHLGRARSPRLGTPEDIAAAVAFLLSDDGQWINGQTLLVDGGANLA